MPKEPTISVADPPAEPQNHRWVPGSMAGALEWLRRVPRPVLAGVLAVVLVAGLVVAQEVAAAGQVRRGVRVGGVELSGLTRAAATDRLRAAAEALKASPLTLQAGDATLHPAPVQGRGRAGRRGQRGRGHGRGPRRAVRRRPLQGLVRPHRPALERPGGDGPPGQAAGRARPEGRQRGPRAGPARRRPPRRPRRQGRDRRRRRRRLPGPCRSSWWPGGRGGPSTGTGPRRRCWPRRPPPPGRRSASRSPSGPRPSPPRPPRPPPTAPPPC